MARTVTYKLEADARNFVSGMQSADKSFTSFATGVTSTTGKLGALSDTVGRTATTMARSAETFGLPVQALRAIDDAADIAEIGLNNLSTAAVGFNAASVGIAGAGLAIGVALGNLLNKLELVRNAADAALEPIAKLWIEILGEGGRADAGFAVGELDKVQDSFIRVQDQLKGQIASAHAAGVSISDLRKQYKDARPEIDKYIDGLEKQDAAQKKASAAAKAAEADLQSFVHDTLMDAQRRTKEFHEEWARVADMASKRIVESYLEQQKALKEIDEEQTRAQQEAQKGVAEMNRAIAEEMARVHAQAREEVLGLADAFFQLANALGGVGGGLAAAAGGFLQVLVAIDDAATKNISTMQKLTSVVNAAGAAYSSGSPLGGAIAGATGGAAFGPLGAAIGGVVGGFLGLFGRGKKRAEELKKKQEEAMNAFSEMFEEWKQLRDELATGMASGVNQLVNSMFEGGEFNAAFTSAANAAEYVMASFNALVASGMSTREALEALAPALEAMAEDAEQFAGTAAEPLIALAKFAEANSALFDFIDGLAATAEGLAAFNMLTQDLATKISTDMAGAIQKMIDAGIPYEQALALNAAALFKLQQAAEASGVTLDSHTQQMINDAEALGLFEDMEDPLKQLVELQGAMVVAMGELVKLMGGSVPAAIQEMIDEFNNAQIRVNVDVNVNQDGQGGGGGGGGGTGTGTSPGGGDGTDGGDGREGKTGGDRGAQHGGVVPFTGPLSVHGTPTRPEYMLTSDQMRRLLENIPGGGVTGRGGQPIVVNVHVGPEKIYEMMYEASRTGHLTVHPGGVRRRG